MVCSYLPVGGDEFEGLGHLMGCGSASYIQEVGWRAAMQLDDVHGGHGQTGSVHCTTQRRWFEIVDVNRTGFDLH